MEFLFSPPAYFLLRKPLESQRKIQKLCSGGVVPTLEHIVARMMVLLEYMLYTWTVLFSQVLCAGVVTPF